MMETVSITLPEGTREFIEEQTVKRGFSSVDDYLRSLIQTEQQRAAQEQLEQLLLEGIQSGPATEMTSDDWAFIRSQVRSRSSAEPA